MINTNIRGALASKLDEIKVTKDDFGADVLAIAEPSFTLSGFNIYWRDRHDDRNTGESFATPETPSLLNNGLE